MTCMINEQVVLTMIMDTVWKDKKLSHHYAVYIAYNSFRNVRGGSALADIKKWSEIGGTNIN